MAEDDDTIESLEPSSDEFLPEVISIEFRDKFQLNKSYLYYIKGGGLFIATNKEYRLGDQVILKLKLIDDPEKFTIDGIIAWITPQSTGGRMKGIGVQFTSENAKLICKKIETYLSGLPKSSTFTI